ncbi:hypothetical protein SNE40_003235 [Patella caerulea]|uniref:DUF4430 domain-containing protein n=1 Tax=Patella caerulea TaxID=87958 RepID=A0AAN8Q4W4_PATCE
MEGIHIVLLVVYIASVVLGCNQKRGERKPDIPTGSTECKGLCDCPNIIDVKLIVQNYFRPDFFEYNVTLRNTTQATLIRHLESAAKVNPHFSFSANYHPQWGYFISTINDLTGNWTLDKTYWRILDSDYNQLQLGASSYVPEHQELVIFNFTTGGH